MITNIVKRIDDEIIRVPLIIRDDQEGWVPTFDIWTTKIDGDTSYIDCTQNFRTKAKDYSTKKIDSEIGCYNDSNLVIYWKTLVDSADLIQINNIYNGKMRACYWRRRYCTYFSTGSNVPWLHSTVVNCNDREYVVHHINGVSVDNRPQNLHILLKKEHDSINHPLLDERKLMFADPKEYWQRRKQVAVNEFITQLALIFTFEGQADFIAKFAEENLSLTKEILKTAKTYINLSSVKTMACRNRILNPNLSDDYLDTYEIEKYLKMCAPKSKQTEGQMNLF